MHFDFKYALLENSFFVPLIILIILQELFPNDDNRLLFVELALLLLAFSIYYLLIQRPFIQKTPSFKHSNRCYNDKLSFYLKLLATILIIAFFVIDQYLIGYIIMMLIWFLIDGLSTARN
ncbi:hypothetical protein [Levilactobacillus brevis]|uniref:hypothetical protein n=1 Tax=Levilactobacillus brevis TaxID=1580 RepID=UPI002072C7C8|nr:hypothetical protein [Levilactobacillus brevis]MCM6797777.1 hypothetical protein [Levilactobacillus brevis]